MAARHPDCRAVAAVAAARRPSALPPPVAARHPDCRAVAVVAAARRLVALRRGAVAVRRPCCHAEAAAAAAMHPDCHRVPGALQALLLHQLLLQAPNQHRA